jgi:outer membrane biogenesis lipoprotein LolB
MKRLLLVLSTVALLGACVTAAAPPPNQGFCPQGQYWSKTSQACQKIPKM